MKVASGLETEPLNSEVPNARIAEKRFCEFFAGIGLVREALGASGWKCIYANDIEPKKREMYVHRFGDDGHFHLGDVHDTANVVARITQRPFLATASFPCTDLSLAGHWRGFEGKHSSAFFGFVDTLEALGDRKPPMILLENVVGFITSKGGRDFVDAADVLGSLGYRLDAFVIDARSFVPQSRPRVFVVGVHRNFEIPFMTIQPDSDWFANDWNRLMERAPASLRPAKLILLMKENRIPAGWGAFDLQSPVRQHYRIEDFIDADESQDWWDQAAVSKHFEMMSDLHRNEVMSRLNQGSTHIGTIYRRKRNEKTMAEVRFDGTAGCLRTPRGGSARQIVIVIHDGSMRMRWMSPREYARLQGAGDFPLVDKTTQNLFGFGDAVCVPVVRWVDDRVLTPVFEYVHDSIRTEPEQSTFAESK